MQQQQPKPGAKEGKQADLSPSVMTSHHRAPQQNTHTEDPLSPYDDGSLDGISDEEGRYIEYFNICVNSSSSLTVSYPKTTFGKFIRSLL